MMIRLILVCVGIVGLGFLANRFWLITSVSCRTASEPCPTATTQALSTLVGKPLLFTKTEAQVLSVIQEYQLPIELSGLRKNYRGELTVEVRLDPDRYLMSTPDQTLYRVSAQGWLTPTDNTSLDLPQIVLSASESATLAAQPRLSAELHYELSTLIELLATHGINHQKMVTLDAFTMVVQLNENQQALIDREEAALNLARLELILNAPNTELDLTQIQEFDVRFKLPVLRTTKTIPAVP